MPEIVPHDCGPLETCDCVNPPRREPWKDEALRLRAEVDQQTSELNDLDSKLGAALRAIGLEHADNERMRAELTTWQQRFGDAEATILQLRAQVEELTVILSAQTSAIPLSR